MAYSGASRPVSDISMYGLSLIHILLVVSTYINREFEQGSVSLGMAMAVLCVLITTTALLIMNAVTEREKK